MRTTILFLTGILLTTGINYAVAQKKDNAKRKDYIRTDSSINVGIELIKGTDVINSQVCKVKKGEDFIEYKPSDIQAYGFSGGRIYISDDIVLDGIHQKVFIEQLAIGDINLYYYANNEVKKFYLEKDESQKIEITGNNHPLHYNNTEKDDLKTFIEEKDELIRNIYSIGINKHSLSALVKQYNGEKPIRTIPYFRYGISLTYYVTELVTTSKTTDEMIIETEMEPDNSVVLGFFADFPLKSSNLYINPEFFFIKNDHSKTFIYEGNNIEAIIEHTSFELPCQLKYIYPSKKIRPYASAGFMYACNYHKVNDILQTEVNANSTTSIYKTNEKGFISKHQWGLTIGSGIECPLKYRKALLFGINYSRLLNIDMPQQLNITHLGFRTGFSF